MKDILKIKASEIITILNEIPSVKNCIIYGSLATNTYDELSDIDIEIDVSGCDNGQFMLELADLLRKKLNIYYSDYAPSLIPNKYILSVAIDEDNPFLIVDLWCNANPHCTTVTKQQVMVRNGKLTHMLKIWTANLKHYIRNDDCRDDIVRMAKKIGIDELDNKDEVTILEESLCWIENNVESNLSAFVQKCRSAFEELVS